jgi:hypothetical protein
MRTMAAEQPTPLPVQALDHATGYLMAAAVVRGITRRMTGGCGMRAAVRARPNRAPADKQGDQPSSSSVARETEGDLAAGVEPTPWG